VRPGEQAVVEVEVEVGVEVNEVQEPATGPTPSARLAFLCTPQARSRWAPEHGPTQCLETHMSWVLRAPGHVLKLKKPVRTPFLDFSTPLARLHDCREEQRLNARLAPGVVLGVYVLHWDGARLHLRKDVEDAQAAAGTLVDAAVHMRRLPDARVLERLLRSQALVDDPAGWHEVDALARVLEAFYRQAPRVAVDARTHLSRLHRELAIDRAVLAPPADASAATALPRLPEAPALLDQAERALARAAPALRTRVRGGHILDGHGDLRPEHVYLLARPLVIDALEFNTAMRQLDPLDELAGLGLECERLGAPWIGPRLLAGCEDVIGGPPDPALVALYRLLRGLRRARLAMAHLSEPAPRTPARWVQRARSYLRLVTDASACASSGTALTT
jgi:aminoglycoside phosphotransferase family enzyme